MSSIWIEILNMSLSASFVALAVMIIRFPLRKVPKVYSYALWAVVFFRLVCPFTITLPVSAVPVEFKAIPQNIAYAEIPSIESGVSIIDDNVNDLMARSQPDTTIESDGNFMETAVTIGTYLWLGVALGLAIYGIISYIRLKYRIRTAVSLQDHVYETDRIKTPFVLGFFRPHIYVPTGLEPKELEYVTAHELTHIRRFDYLIKPLAFLITAVHWFNPLVWLSYALMIRDMELSADESVMKHYDGDVRTAYASSLLALAVKEHGFFTPLAFGEIGVKDRVKNVLRYKKPTLWVSIGAILIISALTLFLVADKEKESGVENIAETVYTTSYDSVSISDLSDTMGFKTTDNFQSDDSRPVAYIDTTIRTSAPAEETPDLDSNLFNLYDITLADKNGKSICKLYYNSLYQESYIEINGRLFETGEDFGRYIDSLFENTGMDFDVDDDDAALFKKYGWTLDYQISNMELEMGNIDSLSAFDANTYYFAYHNELSKDIGLDMSAYGNKNVDVTIFRIHESMPLEFQPTQNCRGIVIKSGNKTIGAFISAGRHTTFAACSLNEKSFEEATGETVETWISNNVQANATEKEMSQLQPEEVIETYIKALDDQDLQVAEACVAKTSLLDSLSVNLLNQDIFLKVVPLPLTDSNFYPESPFENLKSANLIKVEPSYSDNVYAVTVDMEYKKTISIENGEQYWNCTMIYESPETGWKIMEFGQG